MTFFSLYLGKRQNPRGKFAKTFLFLRKPNFSRKIGVPCAKIFFLEVAWKIFGGDFSFYFILLFCENTCALRSWSLASSIHVLGLKRICLRSRCLALASDSFCVLSLGLKGCVLDSTSAMYDKFINIIRQTIDKYAPKTNRFAKATKIA